MTAAQSKWLMRACSAGYETGFRARYNRALGRLEALGYVERDPSSRSHWRVTASGLALGGVGRARTRPLRLAKKLLR